MDTIVRDQASFLALMVVQQSGRAAADVGQP